MDTNGNQSKLKGFFPKRDYDNAWVPGRIIGGITLIAGPLVWFVGLLVRYVGVWNADFTTQQQAWFDEQTFAAPRELAAYAQDPALVTAGYALFAGGTILLFPAILTFARVVAARSPWFAYLGGTMFVAALFARLYFSGIDLTAFKLVDTLGLQPATDFVLASYVDLSYGLWRIPVTASAGSIIGALLLAIGAYRTGTVGLGRAFLLLLFGWVFMGVLKESGLLLGVLGGGLSACLVFVPLGIAALRDRVPSLRTSATPHSSGRQMRPKILSW